MGMPRLVAGVSVIVTGGSEALRATMARILSERGVDAEACADPDGAAASAARGVIELGSLDMSLVPRDATRVLVAALGQARTLGRRLAPDGEGLFVTVQDTGGTFGLDTDPADAADAAWCAGLPALAKTVALEYPRVAVRAIDIARDGRSLTDFAHAIVDELLLGGPEVEIGLPDRQRRLTVVTREAASVVSAVAAAEATSSPSRQRRALRDGQVVVVSGGARGITAHTLVALAREARLRFVLLGRTRPLTAADDPFLHITEESALRTAFAQRARSLGDDSLQPRDIANRVATLMAWRETAASIAALRAAGAEVRYLPLDIRDGAAVAQALAHIRSDWGSIDAVIHAAGVIADKRLADKVDAQVDRVIGTKLDGLAALLDATRDDALAWVCLFSSAAARAGNVGQSDYAMANEVLNKVAQREARRRPDCVVKSIAWGPWDGGMVTPALRDQFTQRGIPLIGLDAGAAFLVRERPSGDRAVAVIAGSGELNTSDQRWVAEVAVSSITHPYLKDHVVNGRPIVPAVLLIEWCVRMAAAIDPLGSAREVRDLNVARPLALRDFARGEVARYIVIARRAPDSPNSNGLAITITDRQGTLHCAATIDLTPAPLATAPASWRTAGGAGVTDWRWNAQEVYDEGRLFHGGDFHVIRSLDGVSNAGAAATIVGVDEQGWPGAPWITDPAALDGGLQLAAAWGVHRTGQHFLPTRVGRVRWIGGAPATGPLRCELSSRLIGRDKMVSDLVFTSADGRVIASLDGLEMFATDAATVTP
jgi:NAD(P)-dependent dehydrogenase (short-subunit alcohol dehydrogenase family)